MSLPLLAAPVNSRAWLRRWATLIWTVLFAGQFVRNLIGYWGYSAFAIALFLLTVGVVAAHRPAWRWRRIPKSGVAFIAFATLSLAWSQYRDGTAIGAAGLLLTSVAGAAIALVLNWQEWIRTLSNALRWILGLSVVFELWVSVIHQGPLLPLYLDVSGKVPAAFYWSRDLLLSGGPIDGIVGNRNLLGFIALLSLIVSAVQVAAHLSRRGWGLVWILVAAAVIALTRSSTVLVAAAAVTGAVAFALITRRVRVERRSVVYGTLLVAAGLVALIWWQAGSTLLGAIGKSPDLTYRGQIWDTVGSLAAQHPLAGWGWIGYWLPWIEPFNGLIVINGVMYLQAHNAWLDVAFQLGIVGVILLAGFVGSTVIRSWFLAVDRPRSGLNASEAFTASALLPLLLVVALVTQSFSESRLLLEGNWALLVVLAFVTKRQVWENETLP